jgi:hypothetical protein
VAHHAVADHHHAHLVGHAAALLSDGHIRRES